MALLLLLLLLAAAACPQECFEKARRCCSRANGVGCRAGGRK
jgi:hypothetical protein